MSLAMTIAGLIAAWVTVAIAMLWGVLRIARAHNRYPQSPKLANAPEKKCVRPLSSTGLDSYA